MAGPMIEMFLRRGLLAAAIICAGATTAPSQEPPRYFRAPDTLRYASDNPFRMYWVRETDTIGAPKHGRSVESHVWHGTAERPELVVRQLMLDVSRRTTTDTFTLDVTGKVLAVNHRAPTGVQRIDLLLRLPETPLVVGTQWSDTLRSVGAAPAGEQWYHVTRSYRVARLVDSLGGRRVADVAALGRIRFRAAYWADSAASRVSWVDVTGPVTEHYLFDVTSGRLLRRSWEMDLRGRGVAPSGPDTLPAGLFSRETFVLDDSPRVRFLLAPLPGADTSASIRMEDGNAILLHVVSRAGERLVSSLARNDALVGQATVVSRSGSVGEYDATWSETGAALVKHRAVIRGDSMVLTRSGQRDTAFALPNVARWGIADHAMYELLAPVLLDVPRDGAQHAFAVLRPYAGRWECGFVTAQERAGLVVIALSLRQTTQPDVLLFTPQGDLLFAEGGSPGRVRRVPTDAARQALLGKMLEGLGRD